VTVAGSTSAAAGQPVPLLTASVAVSHRGALAVQEVTTGVQHVDQVQAVTLAGAARPGSPAPSGFPTVLPTAEPSTSFAPGHPPTATPTVGPTFEPTFEPTFAPTLALTNQTFQLWLDLRVYGLGVVATAPVRYDATARTADELAYAPVQAGLQAGRSLQTALTALSALRQLNVTVSVTSNPPVIDHGATLHAVQWLITFHGADYRLPQLSLGGGGTLIVNRTYAGLAMSTRVVQSANALTGSFRLRCAGDVTSALPANASAQAVATALAPIAGAVGVTRSAVGLGNGHTWTVTFYASPGYADVPLLEGDATGLSGLVSVVTPLSPPFQGSPRPPTVSVVASQYRNGHSATYLVNATATHVQETVQFVYTTTTPGSDAATVFFNVQMKNPRTNQTFLLGPIYPTTVAAIADEIAVQNSNNNWPQDRVPGTLAGTSLQALFRALSPFPAFASDVVVNRTVVMVGSSSLTVTWTAVFVGASANNFVYTVDASSQLSTGGLATVQTLRSPNRIGGSFQLAYGGYTTATLPFDCTASALRAALLQLPSVRDPSLGLGDVAVSRVGPDLQGAYQWLVAVLEDSGSGAAMALESVARATASGGLTGLGASLDVVPLLPGPTGYGLRLSAPQLGTVSAAVAAAASGSPPATAFESVVSVSGAPADIAAALTSLQYRPPTDWYGNATAVVRVAHAPAASTNAYDADATATAVALVPLTVLALNSPPYVLWQGVPLPNGQNVTAEVQSGGRVRLSAIVSFRTGTAVLPTTVNSSRAAMVTADKGLQVADGDIGVAPVTVSLAVLRGSLSVGREAPLLATGVSEAFQPPNKLAINLTLTAGLVTNATARALVLTGSVATVNAALETLTYLSPSNTGYDYVQVAAWDNGNGRPALFGNASCANTLRLHVLPVNHPPVITLLGTTPGLLHNRSVGVVHLQEDQPYALGAHLTVSDPDMPPGDSLRLTAQVIASVTVLHGTVTFGYTTGIQLFANSTGGNLTLIEDQLAPGTELYAYGPKHANKARAVQLKGFFDDIVQALTSAQYVPDPLWYGVDAATVYLNDQGGAGSGGALSASQTIVLNVANVPSAPAISLPEVDTMWRWRTPWVSSVWTAATPRRLPSAKRCLPWRRAACRCTARTCCKRAAPRGSWLRTRPRTTPT
jgi:hypothetical protein